MFKLTMDSTQVKAMIRWLDKFERIVREPETMSAGVKNIGIGMQAQFKGEGSHYGSNWRMLSKMTQQLRESRGYGAEHPILVQSGALKYATADALRSYVVNTTAMTRNAPGVSMIAYSAPLTFVAKASGPKMVNHSGGRAITPDGMEVTIPARPFFGFGDLEQSMAFEASFRRVMSQWASKSTLATRTK